VRLRICLVPLVLALHGCGAACLDDRPTNPCLKFGRETSIDRDVDRVKVSVVPLVSYKY